MYRTNFPSADLYSHKKIKLISVKTYTNETKIIKVWRNVYIKYVLKMCTKDLWQDYCE